MDPHGHEPDEWELYDLSSDARELVNLLVTNAAFPTAAALPRSRDTRLRDRTPSRSGGEGDPAAAFRLARPPHWRSIPAPHPTQPVLAGRRENKNRLLVTH
jgi:hypothetical protein